MCIRDRLNAAKIGEIAEAHGEYDRYHDGTNVTLLCIINSVRLKTTKNNSTMAFVQIEDLYGGIEMLVFPKVLAEFGHLLKEGSVVQLKGRVSAREEEEPKIICEQVLPPPGGETEKKSRRPGLYLRMPSASSREDVYKRQEAGCCLPASPLFWTPRRIFPPFGISPFSWGKNKSHRA